VRRRLAPVVAVALVASLSACSDDALNDVDGPRTSTTITVFAAASLKSSFTTIGTAFEAENKGVTVRFSFAGSSDLVAQLQQGAPADVFASADTETMDDADDLRLLAAEPVDFATNTLQIVTPPDDPAHIDSLADLTDPDADVVVCAPQVPCGAAAQGVEKAAGLDIEPVSEEQSVTDVLNKVVSGEADAGLVYVTDVAAAGASVRGVTIPQADDVVNTYPIAPLADSDHADEAAAFAAFVTGPEGQAILAAAGFGQP
jgi:molybdate transport system substrate-binding protein